MKNHTLLSLLMLLSPFLGEVRADGEIARVGHVEASAQQVTPRFEIVRHTPSGFDLCSRAFLPERSFEQNGYVPGRVRGERHSGGVEDLEPLDELQRFYFEAHRARGSLDEEAIRYYEALPRNYESGKVSLIFAKEGEALDSVLTVFSSTTNRWNHIPLPLERKEVNGSHFEIPYLVDQAGREGRVRFTWEIGRARGGRHYRQALVHALAVIYAELFNTTHGWRNPRFTEIGQAMDFDTQDAWIYIHAANRRLSELYQSERYGLELVEEQDSNNFILRRSLHDLLDHFHVFEEMDRLHGYTRATGINDPRMAFDFVLAFRSFHIPRIYRGTTGVFESSRIIRAKREYLQGLIDAQLPGIQYESIRQRVDVRSRSEHILFDRPVPLETYRELFGTDNLNFVDGVEHWTELSDGEIVDWVKRLLGKPRPYDLFGEGGVSDATLEERYGDLGLVIRVESRLRSTLGARLESLGLDRVISRGGSDFYRLLRRDLDRVPDLPERARDLTFQHSDSPDVWNSDFVGI